MIMKLSFYRSIICRSNNKFRWYTHHLFQSRQLKRNSCCHFLIIFHLDDLHLVPATTIGLMHPHSTLATFLGPGSIQLTRSQPVHTVMIIHDYPCRHSEVANEQYGDPDFPHNEHHKYRLRNYSIKANTQIPLSLRFRIALLATS